MSRSVSERSRSRSAGTVEIVADTTSDTTVDSFGASNAAAERASAASGSIWDRTITLEDVLDRLGFLGRFLRHAGILEILAMAAVLRALYVLTPGFPLNDGGLFYVFARDIQAAGYMLPEFSSYNDGTIPFAYPPLAFYLAAFVDDVTPLSLLDVIWLLPMIESVALVGAFYLLAKALLHDRWTVLLATTAFALLPRSFIWLIMGGGLTRALALTCTLLAIHQARQACIEHRWQPAARASVLLAVTVLTTLETAAWAAVSLPLFTLFPFERRRLITLGAIGLGTLALVAPWGLLVISYHGLDPFMSAREFGGSAIGEGTILAAMGTLLNPTLTGEPYFPVIAGLGLLGAVYLAMRGAWLLPVWWVLTVVMATRAFPTLAAIPTAMMAGVAVRQVIAPALLHAGGSVAVPRTRAAALGLVGGVVLVFLVIASLTDTAGDQQYLRALTPAEVEAMEWIAAETPEDGRFLVLSRNGWYADRDGEWFPALAERENVATVQGYEWVSGEFDRRLELQALAQTCTPGPGNCLGELSLLESFDYIYIPETCCENLRAMLETEWRYAVIFDNGAAVMQVVTGPVRPEAPEGYSEPDRGASRDGGVTSEGSPANVRREP